MLMRPIRYLKAVADHGSFTRAAAALHESQPALSQQIRERSRCRHGGDCRRHHPAAPREIRPEHASRPVSRSAASADRGQAEEPASQTARSHHAAAGDRSDGRPETQSRAGTACNRCHDGQAKPTQGRSRPAPAVIALTRGRRQKAEGAAHDRSGGCRCQVAKEGMNAAKRITLALLSARRLMGR